ncbi:ribonuclease H-like [Mastacembelus armatus]|uniref:ribonuclease H-like n=1 Tax=Mastacembelus armatus TaxID=205130 RepID=UPI000E456BF8|nr:ribonuclease H-like [Mastacembelus armatus]
MAEQMMEGEPHQCEERIIREIKIRPDLSSIELEGEAETVFTDGCCYRHPTEGLKAGYAVIREAEEGFEVLKAERLRERPSAQLAELKAVTEALKWGKGKRINIYTDSAYVVGAAQTELRQWVRAGFQTASQQPIKHEEKMRELAEVLMGPQAVAIIKCKGH